MVTAAGLLDQVVMVAEILRVPQDVKGVVVECAGYQGGSTTNFFLVCPLVGRELHVFRFLCRPACALGSGPTSPVPSILEIRTFGKGDWCGAIEVVKNKVRALWQFVDVPFSSGLF